MNKQRVSDEELHDVCAGIDAGADVIWPLGDYAPDLQDTRAELATAKAKIKQLRGDMHRKLGNLIGPEIFRHRELLCSSHTGKGTGLTCSSCDTDVAGERDKFRAELATAQAEAERLREQNNARAEYTKALEEELGNLSGFAHAHGWRSKRYEEGKRLRDKIRALKSESTE